MQSTVNIVFHVCSAEILSLPSAILPLDALKYSENGNPTKPYRVEFPIPISVLALAGRVDPRRRLSAFPTKQNPDATAHWHHS